MRRKNTKIKFGKALSQCFKDDLVIKETGTYIIKRKIKVNDELEILLHSVSYINQTNEHNKTMNVYLYSRDKQNSIAYEQNYDQMSVAYYKFCLDLSKDTENELWECVEKRLFHKNIKNCIAIHRFIKKYL